MFSPQMIIGERQAEIHGKTNNPVAVERFTRKIDLRYLSNGTITVSP
jgi:hypothetical protein